MKTLGLLLVLSAGSVFAGSSVVMQESSSMRCPELPPIPQPVMQGIKDLAVRRNPGEPKAQVEEVTRSVGAYLALRHVPDNPGKQAAAEDYPFDFQKQLYLAQRPLQN